MTLRWAAAVALQNLKLNCIMHRQETRPDNSVQNTDVGQVDVGM